MFYNFPDQTIPESQKNKEWHKKHIIEFLSFSNTDYYKDNKKEMEKLYYSYLAKIHPDDEEIIKATITERYCDINFGPQYDIYPLIENNIEQLIGDYRLRPLRIFALTQNKDAVVAKLDEMYDVVLEKLTRDAHKDISETEGISIPTERPELELPENIDKEFFKNYRTGSEKQAENILYFLLVIKKEKEKIYEAILHYLVTGAVSMIMIEKDGHPSIHIPNNLSCTYDINPHSILQDNPQYFAYDEFMSLNDIYNNYDLSVAEKKIVSEYPGDTKSNMRGSLDAEWFMKADSKSPLRIRAITLIWKSRIKKKFKKFKNEEGVEGMKILPDDYNVGQKEKNNIVTLEIEDIRHCTMIGPNLVLEFGAQKDQLKTKGDDKKRFIHVVSLNTNNKSGINSIRSIAKKLDFLQKYASEILYEIKLTMRQIDGGALVYDLANIPKEWMKLGVDKAIEKVNFTIKRDRTMYINTADKKSNGYASSVQLSQKSRLSDLTALLGLIESLAEKISGNNASKMGQTADYAKTGVAQMNMLQSSARIENIYGPFDTFVEKFLERIILKAQHIYKDGDMFNYYAGDDSLSFLKIMPEFFIDDLGITLSDPRKEMEAKQIVTQASGQILANANDPKAIIDLIKITMSDSSSEAIEILERGIDQMQKAAEERQKAVAQQEQAAKEAQEQAAQETLELKREGYKNNIDVANIYADNKTQQSKDKEANQNFRKAADIEHQQNIKELEIQNKNLEKSEK